MNHPREAPQSGSDNAPQDSLAQAAEWFATLQDEDVTNQQRRRWQQWLRASAEHRQAWSRVEQIDRQFRGLPPVPVRQALEAAGRSRRRFLSGLATVAIAAPLGWTAWQSGPARAWRADASTAVGQVRELSLPDGSRLWLNTQSAVNLSFNDHQRLITLLDGEVNIQTAADARPMTVDTPEGRMTPLGTRFSVRSGEGLTRVAVSEGQ
ncbi:MAG: FecR domain-containing protein, partial [Oleiphilaceae bacterium]|nr:FecR domain-containing protein [Oleiphilaceae bacterium]